MNKAYNRTNWENYPSDVSPINEANLNKIEAGVDEIDNRVITLDTTKATKVEVSTLVQDITFNESNGVFTITKKNGSVLMIDTKLEKIAVNFSYDSQSQQIILTLIDGTIQYIDLTSLITQYEFMDTDTVSFIIDETGKVSAIVNEGSIEEKHLRPNYLAEIKVQAAAAESSKVIAENSANLAKESETAAKESENNSKKYADKSQSYAVGGTGTRTEEDTDNSKYYYEQAKNSKELAENNASIAVEKAAQAKTSEISAASSANIASNKATEANSSAISAANSATTAASNATSASASAESAANYAVGNTESAKYYYEQVKNISESVAGTLRPMGTVSFVELPLLENVTAGDMYNISDEFITTSEFKEGVGNIIPAGANIYKTTDGKWDVLAGNPVVGVKGNAESSYRRGNVNITPENLGAVNKAGDTMNGTLVQKNVTLHDGVNKVTVMQAYDDGDGNNYGSELVIGANGNTFLGSGESSKNLQSTLSGGGNVVTNETYGQNAERLYLTSDNAIYLETNCNTIGNRKCVVIDTSGKITAPGGFVGDVKGTAANADYAASAGNDGNGNKISDTYQTKTGDTNNNVATFTTSDTSDSSASSWTSVSKLGSGEKHSSIFEKLSKMFKNIRFLYKMLGTTNISSIGNGTCTGAISSLNDSLTKKLDVSVYGPEFVSIATDHWSIVTQNGVGFPSLYNGCCIFRSDKKCDIHLDVLLRDNFGTYAGITPHTQVFSMEHLRNSFSFRTLSFDAQQTKVQVILGERLLSKYANDPFRLLCTNNMANFSGLRFTEDGRITRRYYTDDGQIAWGNLYACLTQEEYNTGAYWNLVLSHSNILRIDIFGADYTC